MTEAHQRKAGKPGNAGLDDEPGATAKTFMRLLGDLQIIVVEAHQAEAECHPKHHPHVRIGGVCPQ